jgi:hypothetical protein
MKNYIAEIFGFGFAFALMGFLIFMVTQTKECYNQRCEILAKYGTLVSVVRADGNIYDFEDEEDVYNVGDEVIVTFDDNGSKQYILDDKIVKVEILKK